VFGMFCKYYCSLKLTVILITLIPGRQPQYMRDRPNGYLFVDVEDCCKARE
jgi:hypothetical protein